MILNNLADWVALLTLVGFAHLFLQLFNRYFICIADGPIKAWAHRAWGFCTLVAPAILMAVFWRTEFLQDALRLSPRGPLSWVVFLIIAALWVYMLGSFLLWVSDRVAPVRSEALLSETILVPKISKPRSRSRLIPKAFDTTFDLRVVKREISLPNLPAEFDGLTIAHVADIHFEPRFGRMKYFMAVQEIVNSWNADIVAFTGDFITTERFIKAAVRFHSLMTGRLASLCVLGNHDYWTRPDLVRAEATRRGIQPLHGRKYVLERNGRRLIFVGSDSPWGGMKTNWRALTSKGPGDAMVLLSHTPDNAPRAARLGVDLVLSGHNHGGQYRFPIIGPIVIPAKTGHRFVQGVYSLGPECVLNVSGGIGVSSHHGGSRMLCPPEVILLTLRSRFADIAVPAKRESKRSSKLVATGPVGAMWRTGKD